MCEFVLQQLMRNAHAHTGLQRITAIAAAVLAIGSCSVFRVPDDTTVAQVPLETSHSSTEWHVAPSYEYDAICFIGRLAGDDYYTQFFRDEPTGISAAEMRERLTPQERRAVDRLFGTLHDRFGAVPASTLSALYAATGSSSLDEFRESIADPRAFREEHAETLDSFYASALGGWRLPGFAVNRILGDLSTYFRALERLEFAAYRHRSVEPELQQLASELSAALDSYNVVPVAEELIGGGYPSNEIRVHLARFARPHGISLGATSLVMEERTDAENLVRVTIHELLHGWVDWSASPTLRAFVGRLRDDPIVRRAFEGRNRDYGYNSWTALAEEGLTKALDQIGSEALGVATDHRERWFFQDDGMHVLGLAFYTVLTDSGYPESRSPGLTIQEHLSDLVLAGRLDPGTPTRIWRDTYGESRPGGYALVLPGGGRVPLRFVFAGNWTDARNGINYFYRNALFFRLPPGHAPPDHGELVVVHAADT